MKKSIIISVLLFCIMPFYAQVELRKQSVDSGGAVVQSGNISVVFTVGEVVVAEGNTSTYHISEGFIGPEILQVLGLEESTEMEGVNVFPNPVVNQLYISLPDHDSYIVQIYNMDGKLLIEKHSQSEMEYMIDLEQMQASTLLVMIKNQTTQKTKVLKLLKK